VKEDTVAITASAVYAFIGVLLGSATTVALTVYREQVVSRREREAREHQRMQERHDQRDAFQRQSLLALQDAVSDLVKAVFNEQDRMLAEMRRTGSWPVRQWETPTAAGGEDAELRLQVSRARVFVEELRDRAQKIHAVARESVWASSLDQAKELNQELEEGHQRFNDLVAKALPELY
jgi:hypothetical protein